MPVDKTPLGQDSEPARFLFTMYGLIGQVFNILFTCTYYNLTPFIRYNITFHYFKLFMHNFLSDKMLKKKIEDAIITYIFYHRIDKERISKIPFDDYFEITKDFNFFYKIRNEIESKQLNIFNGKLNKLIKLIEDNITVFYSTYF